MSRTPDEIRDALAAPFEPHLVQTRKKGGKTVRFVDAPTVLDRFDQVVGVENWMMSFHQVDRGVECTISVYFEGRGWVPKANVGGYPGMTETTKGGEVVDDDENDVKGGYSDAIKRAGMAWGVGRYLYRKAPENGGGRPNEDTPRGEFARPGTSDPANAPAPKTGKALYRWARDRDPAGGLVRYLQSWGRLNEFPGRMVDWSPSQAAEAHAEALRKLDEVREEALTS